MVIINLGPPHWSGELEIRKFFNPKKAVILDFLKIKEVLNLQKENNEFDSFIVDFIEKIIFKKSYSENFVLKNLPENFTLINFRGLPLKTIGEKGVEIADVKREFLISQGIENLEDFLKLNSDKEKSEFINEELNKIDEFFIKKEVGSEFYNTSRWKQTRNAVMARDKYKCKICEGLGVSKDAEEVHHIQLASIRPDLIYVASNLISLCKAHHLSLHDHLHHSLSDEGKRLQESNKLENPDNYAPPWFNK